MFTLAHDLGKTIGEIRAMPAAEITEWMGFYKFRAWQASQAAGR